MDTYNSIQLVSLHDFTFTPTMWSEYQGGKLTSQMKKTHVVIKCNKQGRSLLRSERYLFTIESSDSQLMIAPQFEFDRCITSNDRLLCYILPRTTNAEAPVLWTLPAIGIPYTREKKVFSQDEPCAGSIFTEKGRIVKVSFTFGNPERLIEFETIQQSFLSYILAGDNDPKEGVYEFKSSDHIRYEGGVDVSGHNYGCHRTVRIEKDIKGRKGYSVTTINDDGVHPLWGTNIQMSTKPMRIIRCTSTEIELRGYGYDDFGVSFADYGLTLNVLNGSVMSCVLHMYDRNVDIEYLP